jgi:hypothetical protein
MLSFRLPREQIARLEKWARLNEITRSEAIRALLRQALQEA